jgi:galactokinase
VTGGELLAGAARAALERGGLSAAAAEAKSPLFSRAAEALVQRGMASESVVYAFFVPGRIEVLGKHTDYAGGRSIVTAVERGFCMVAAAREDTRVTVTAVEQDECIDCELAADLVVPESGWANYPMTVMRRLARNFGDLRGVDIAFLSDLPAAAGMSSSSAFMVATYLVLAARNGLHEREIYRRNIREDLALAAYLGTVENGQSFGELAGDRGVGTFGGSEDHTAILCSQPGQLGQFAYCPARLERRIDLPEDYVFAVGFCGVVAEKTGAAQELYNRAALQVGAIVEAWRTAMGGSEVYLADVLGSGPEAAAQLEAILADVSGATYSAAELTQRLRHFLVEDGEIIDAAAVALASAHVEVFAEQIRRSQRMGVEVLGNQIAETEDMARLACEEGALAASAFGAGFGGGVWALVHSERAETFLQAWEKAYRAAHSQRAEKALYFFSRPGPAAFAL